MEPCNNNHANLCRNFNLLTTPDKLALSPKVIKAKAVRVRVTRSHLLVKFKVIKVFGKQQQEEKKIRLIYSRACLSHRRIKVGKVEEAKPFFFLGIISSLNTVVKFTTVFCMKMTISTKHRQNSKRC